MPQLPGGEADPGTACASHNSLLERGVPCKISKHIKKNREEDSLNTFYITKKNQSQARTCTQPGMSLGGCRVCPKSPDSAPSGIHAGSCIAAGHAASWSPAAKRNFSKRGKATSYPRGSQISFRNTKM